MQALGVMCAVALARLVVAVSSQRVAVAIALTLEASTAAGHGRAEAPWATVLTVGPCGPV